MNMSYIFSLSLSFPLSVSQPAKTDEVLKAKEKKEEEARKIKEEGEACSSFGFSPDVLRTRDDGLAGSIHSYTSLVPYTALCCNE